MYGGGVAGAQPAPPMRAAGPATTGSPQQAAFNQQQSNIHQQASLLKAAKGGRKINQMGGESVPSSTTDSTTLVVPTVKPMYTNTLAGGTDPISQQMQNAGTYNQMSVQAAGDKTGLVK